MKICLVPYPVLVESSSPDTPNQLDLQIPLGLLTIASLLEKAGHEITIFDPVVESETAFDKIDLPDPQHVADLIKAKTPELVGFSTMFSTYPITLEWAKYYHESSPQTPILLGGPQATDTDEQTLRAFPWISMVLRGEVENSIVSLVDCLQHRGDLNSVGGLSWRNGSQVVRNPDAPIVTEIDTIPMPAFHLYPVEKIVQIFNSRFGMFYHNFPLEAGRGCPFNCSYCSSSHFFHRRYRAKSVERLKQEIVFLHTKYGLNNFDLFHDLFTCDRSYVLAFCKSLKNTGLHKKIKWRCNSRVDTVDKQVLEEMAEAGCSGISYGIETGSPRMQKLIGKNLSIEEINSVIDDTLLAGINVSASFICGFPQENMEDLTATFVLIMDLIARGVQVFLLPLCPLISSEIYHTFGDTLVYDGPWSELTHGRLGPEYEEQIKQRPQIFAGFYHFKISLDEDMIRALVRVINRHPYLITALLAEKVDLIPVFRRWPEWYRAHVKLPLPYYYWPKDFFRDFFQFLNEDLKTNEKITPRIHDLVRWHSLYEQVSLSYSPQPVIETFNTDVNVLMSHLINKTPIKDEELQPTTYIFGKINGKLIAKPLMPALEELFRDDLNIKK